MNQLGWIILFTLIVWARCDSQLESYNDHQMTHTEDSQNIDLHVQSPPNDEENVLDDENESESGSGSDIDPSASSYVESVKNQSKFNSNLVNMMKDNNLFSQLEQLKNNPSLWNYANGHQHLTNDVMHKLANNFNNNNFNNSEKSNDQKVCCIEYLNF